MTLPASKNRPWHRQLREVLCRSAQDRPLQDTLSSSHFQTIPRHTPIQLILGDGKSVSTWIPTFCTITCFLTISISLACQSSKIESDLSLLSLESVRGTEMNLTSKDLNVTARPSERGAPRDMYGLSGDHERRFIGACSNGSDDRRPTDVGC